MDPVNRPGPRKGSVDQGSMFFPLSCWNQGLTITNTYFHISEISISNSMWQNFVTSQAFSDFCHPKNIHSNKRLIIGKYMYKGVFQMSVVN